MAEHDCILIDGVCATCRASMWAGEAPLQSTGPSFDQATSR